MIQYPKALNISTVLRDVVPSKPSPPANIAIPALGSDTDDKYDRATLRAALLQYLPVALKMSTSDVAPNAEILPLRPPANTASPKFGSDVAARAHRATESSAVVQNPLVALNMSTVLSPKSPEMVQHPPANITSP